MNVSKLLADLSALLNGANLIQLGGLVVLVLMLLIVFLLMRRSGRKVRALAEQKRRTEALISSLGNKESLEERLLVILQQVALTVSAEYYAFYMPGSSGEHFVLKALRQRYESDNTVEVSYSRLLAYARGGYSPPVKLTRQLPEEVTLEQVDESPEITIPFGPTLGFVTLEPTGSCSRQQLARLEEFRKQVMPLLGLLHERAGQAEQSKGPEQPGALVRNTSDQFDLLEPIRGLLTLIGKLVRADGSVLLMHKGEHLSRVVPQELKACLNWPFFNDSLAQQQLIEWSKESATQAIGKDSPTYARLLPSAVALGDFLLLIKVPTAQLSASILLWGDKPFLGSASLNSILQPLLQRMVELIVEREGLLASTTSYLLSLRDLAITADRSSAHTVGHSELVARYSLAIARELQLNEQQCRDIAFAAILHDLGMIGLPEDLLYKPGAYTPEETARIHQHPDLGADIISATLAHEQVAQYVRHHHEQWDGSGYPYGLRGETIPIGARIICVAEVFIAKLSGRNYREPLNFEEALAGLRSAAGTQLDPQVVEALLGWYKRKWAELPNQFQPLAPCWVMRCCPEDVYSECPACSQEDRNCWSVEGVKCASHGSVCASCMIYTEYKYRTRRNR